MFGVKTSNSLSERPFESLDPAVRIWMVREHRQSFDLKTATDRVEKRRYEMWAVIGHNIIRGSINLNTLIYKRLCDFEGCAGSYRIVRFEIQSVLPVRTV